MLNLLNAIYGSLGIEQSANMGDLIGLISIASILTLALVVYFGGDIEGESDSTEKIIAQPKKKDLQTNEEREQIDVSKQKPVEVAKPPKPEVSWSDRLKKGLQQSQTDIWGKVSNIFSSKGLSADSLEEIEEILYAADLGPETVSELIDHLEEKYKEAENSSFDFKDTLYTFLNSKISPIQDTLKEDLFNFNKQNHKELKVIMIVGVNGAGKTTTIGKLATKLQKQGANVVVGACDTFRAAAVDQLQVWCDRAQVTMVRAKEGANPSGVGYEALQKAQSLGADYCLLDTAGRLHTKENLMDELKKSKNVLKKLDQNAPHHTLLVIDAITGQNAINQAIQFNESLGLSGLIFTKCDGTSKAGSAIGIVNKLHVPITYIGVGETVEDLNVFNTKEYLGALLDM